jgi:hypothetical protein
MVTIYAHHYYLSSQMTTYSWIIKVSKCDSGTTHQHPPFREPCQYLIHVQYKLLYKAHLGPKGCYISQLSGHFNVLPNMYFHILSNPMDQLNPLICWCPVPFSLLHFLFPFCLYLCDSVQDIHFAVAIVTFLFTLIIQKNFYFLNSWNQFRVLLADGIVKCIGPL